MSKDIKDQIKVLETEIARIQEHLQGVLSEEDIVEALSNLQNKLAQLRQQPLV